MRNSFALLVYLILLPGCSETPTPDYGEMREALANQLLDIEMMTNQGHLPDTMSAKYLEFFSSDPSVLPYSGDLLEGREAVSAFYSSVFSMGTLGSNSYTEPTIRITEGFAVRIYQGTAEIQLSGSEKPMRYTNVYTDVLVREDGVWKIDWHSWVPAPSN
jgi:ketosteroid isomerase-like protein